MDIKCILADFCAWIVAIYNKVIILITPSASVVTDWAKGSIFWYQLILSLISALIFWVAFNHIPERTRKNKLRPVIDLDLVQIRSQIFMMFDSVMRQSPIRSIPFYQPLIQGGKLSRIDIRTGLQNKCQNENYFYDLQVKDYLMPIGNDLYEYSKTATELIDKISSLSQFVSAEEIILLERIRQELKRFDLRNDLLTANPSNIYFRPVISSLLYLEEPLVTLYSSFMALQEVVFGSATFNDTQCFINQMQYLYNSGRYKKCYKNIATYLKRNKISGDEAYLYRSYQAQCTYHLGSKSRFYKLFGSIFIKRPFQGNLLACRLLLKDFLDDSGVLEILQRHYSKEEISELINYTSQETHFLDEFISNAKKLSLHYATLDKRLTPLQ